jgi:SAM-dependent methyltransferase
MNQSGDYSPRYFDSIRHASRSSAEIIAPLVLEIAKPRSVVDVGCGTGAWAAAFKRLGVSDVLGIDGDYCDRQSLEIAPIEFLPTDVGQPIELKRKFDLAVCLEVAEHLEARHADQLIANLVTIAPAILFSAAVPGQEGEHHVNEQWPSYWIQRFASHGYSMHDTLRAEIWENPSVAWWYAQNLLLFCSRDAVLGVDDSARGKPTLAGLPVVHPQLVADMSWRNRTLLAGIQIINATNSGARMLLLDEARLASLPALDREISPFPASDGEYSGPPSDSESLILALERRRAQGYQYLVIAWPAFWWLDHYRAFAAQLLNSFEEITRTEEVIVFRF